MHKMQSIFIWNKKKTFFKIRRLQKSWIYRWIWEYLAELFQIKTLLKTYRILKYIFSSVILSLDFPIIYVWRHSKYVFVPYYYKYLQILLLDVISLLYHTYINTHTHTNDRLLCMKHGHANHPFGAHLIIWS